jgi:ATP-dependent protease ClpP protease subunit
MAIEIRNETPDSAELYLSGSIVDDEMGGIMEEWCDNTTGYQWPDKIKSQLESLKGKALTIYINSDGGSVPAGVAMANMIARHDGRTTAIVDGWCCSIATQVFFAADRRQIPANAYLMIHKPAVYAGGNADDLRKSAEVLDTIQRGLEEAYIKAARAGVTAETIHQMVNKETWLTGKEAAEFFAVELLEASQMAACVGSTKFMQHIPEGLRRVSDVKPLEEPPAARAAEEECCQKAAAEEKRCLLAVQEMRQRAEIALALAKGAMI